MIAQQLTQELHQEADATRRVLERVPADHLSWRPHAKSMSLGQLALHIATTPGQVAELASQPSIDLPNSVQTEASSVEEVLQALETSLAQATEILGGLTDEAMHETWRVMSDDQEVMAMPRAAVFRMIMLNHWYHHRGQMMVYLRLLDIPLPSVYGPTADENPFMG
ncbi:MAG: DinB family protein [Thermoanaerobaculia bacterium]|nr:DinB family protein [Thermoanaerobaculia bacterium]